MSPHRDIDSPVPHGSVTNVHGYVYIVVRPDDAGHATHSLFVPDFDARLAAIAGRGLRPAQQETYDNGVRKATFHDPDGNETAFGGGPAA